MIPLYSIMSIFQTMLKQHWPYVWGAAQKGCVDCSGAFVYAYKQNGCSIYHGSNRIAREHVECILPMEFCEPGYAVFKLRNPQHSKYALPSAYKVGGAHYNGDLNDYYHIGLMGFDGKIMNAQSASTGFVNSSADTWHCCGKLIDVDYDAVEKPSIDTVSGAAQSIPSDRTDTNKAEAQSSGTYNPTKNSVKSEVAKVVAKSGSTVNMRSGMSKKDKIVLRVPVGASVEIVDSSPDGWCAVKYKTAKGYMMKEFLQT